MLRQFVFVSCAILLSLFLVGCATVPQYEGPDRLPKLYHHQPLPPYMGTIAELRLDIRLHIAADGSVDDVDLLRSSGDASWDSLAVEQIRKWKYVPASAGGKAIPLWIMQSVLVQFVSPMPMYLAEIVCSSREIADSLYARIEAGEDFASVARTASIGPTAVSGGVLGEVDIRTYPKEVLEVLRKLSVGAYTKPLEVGVQFIIFKRLVDLVPTSGDI